MNKVILIGNLGGDPELSYTESGKAMCKFSIATNKRIDGEDKTTWHNIVCWEKIAESVAEHKKKGDKVAIDGEIDVRKYEKDGQKHTYVSIVARHVTFL